MQRWSLLLGGVQGFWWILERSGLGRSGDDNGMQCRSSAAFQGAQSSADGSHDITDASAYEGTFGYTGTDAKTDAIAQCMCNGVSHGKLGSGQWC